ncbi:ATP-binding cassette sub-family G member 4-like [Ctenocephalides felis]|uniref:ATP-binding cassette sub-family G member 4-like n=1 Tax=Ctenocephalides felis TaxID=7515 RepID=UPI000E6E2A96|nr:ATP-binding cassette sub-family G member 4-like [Ctenocephalides felis]
MTEIQESASDCVAVDCDNANYNLLTDLSPRPPVDIEFQDLTYAVRIGGNGQKSILRGVSGCFRSGELTAIMGISGAGKSTLLNILAGYKAYEATGSILVNGSPRDIRLFRKMSRYIMQEDLLQPRLTVAEAMKISADLKLGNEISTEQKEHLISEILSMLRLNKTRNTTTSRLSGGECKRLSIALEMVNNPPVIFLDEPTTGLDDMASSQCVQLLKHVASGGRTVICSIHTPSAKLFAMFDHVYIVAAGQCIYQGAGEYIVPYLSSLGLHCPIHYNPADFVIEVSSGEYGEHNERMVAAIENGRRKKWMPLDMELINEQQNKYISARSKERHFNEELKAEYFKRRTTFWQQFKILFCRKVLQDYRNPSNMWLKIVLYIFLALLLGSTYYGMGNDASKTLFNFGYCFTCTISFLYLPMLPLLLSFPTDVQLLKREHFNRWYSLNSYYMAMTLSRLPLQLFVCVVYVTITYTLSGQPLEISRAAMFLCTCILLALVSEAMGVAIGSTLNVINAMFVGPCVSVPLMLLAVYGYGSGTNYIPIHIKIAMALDYMRYGMEGLIYATYGNDRPDLICPEEEIYCQYKKPKYIMQEMGMSNVTFWYDAMALIIIFIMCNFLCLYLLKQRLNRGKTFAALYYVRKLIESKISLTRSNR